MRPLTGVIGPDPARAFKDARALSALNDRVRNSLAQRPVDQAARATPRTVGLVIARGGR